ncbi:MAG: hypothetical protein L0Y72_28220 [Gemmataceae bacterium]|nr:hypothetical protein [Gemmataceae bacterium]MCI0742934.1 hypothetical protein [Gemmataceae bacterium]
MRDFEQIKHNIRQVLQCETTAIGLCEKLFSPDHGLFSQLAQSEEERRTVASSSLFLEAQSRLRELQLTEATAFAKSVDQAQNSLSAGTFHWKTEGIHRSESA